LTLPEYLIGLSRMSSIVAFGTFISHCCLQRCATAEFGELCTWPCSDPSQNVIADYLEGSNNV
jgi:hypothetical protein